MAALKTALKVHGIVVSEAQLIQQLPFDHTPKQAGVWGNPNQGFVGDIDGQMLVTGYGVHWDPIARLGAKYATTQIMRHGSAVQLAQQIAQGNPVIIWGYYGSRRLYSWQTPTGTPIQAINGEHTMVVYGFDGPVTAPTRFHVMDPVQGSLSWSTEDLLYNWSGLNHMGVVVMPAKVWVRVPHDTTIWEINPQKKTRQEIVSWAAFVKRGGSPTAIKSIDSATLVTYTVGSPIQ